MNTSSELYGAIGKIHAQRKASQIWNSEQVERYVDDNFYAFSRGEFLVFKAYGETLWYFSPYKVFDLEYEPKT